MNLAWIAMAAAVAAGGDGVGDGRKWVMVEAWRKDGPHRKYRTVTLDHLPGFEAEAAKLGRFGGRAGKRLEATGAFRARKLGDRWWLIDPDGHPFLHVAVNAVRMGRGPAMKKAFARHFSGKADWAGKTASMLREHGFNGTGSWSDDALLAEAQPRMVYTPNWKFMTTYGKQRGGMWQVAGHKAFTNDCIFAFDPNFATFAERHARKLAATADDPYLLGHFTDNELPFPRDLLDKALKLPAKDPTRIEAVRWLTERRHSAEADLTEADRDAWRGHVAETYLGIVSRAIRKVDPNHLVLGPRFHGSEKRCREVWAAAGRHCDVIAVNVYGVWTPRAKDVARWQRWSGRPVLVTEWYAKGHDSGMANLTGAGWTVPTQADRGRFYQAFVIGLLRSKACVGWHWFKYQDNDPADKTTDPSNRDSNKGIVSAGYEPYTPLLEAMRRLNDAVYPLVDYLDARE